MDWINHISIKNFKSIKDLEINDCNKINLFLGYPNVGKSNILEALTLLRASLIPAELNLFVRYKTFFNLFHKGNVSEKISVAVNHSEVTEIKYHDINNVIINKFFTGGEFPIEFNSNKNTGLRNIMKYLYKENKLFQNSPEQNLSYNGSNLLQILQTNSKLRVFLKEILKDYNLKLSVDVEQGELKLQSELEDGIVFTIPYNLSAETLQRLIFHVAAVYSNIDTKILFEEPEVHFFPPYLEYLTRAIAADETNQFFISTHSTYLLNDFFENESTRKNLAVYIVGIKDSTTIYRLTDKELLEMYNFGVDLFFNIDRDGFKHSA